MGWLRSLVRWSISNHYLFLAPLYVIEFLRDLSVLQPWLVTVDAVFYIPTSVLLNVLPKDGIFSSRAKLLFKANEAAVYVTALFLTMEKVYIIVTKFPRATYKGFIGLSIQRWIRYHWMSIGFIIMVKKCAEMKLGVFDVLGIQAERTYLFFSLFFLFEALYGLVNKAYVLYNRRSKIRASKRK